MNTAVIIPTTDKVFPTFLVEVREYLRYGFTVVVPINGCTLEESVTVERALETEEGDLRLMYAGSKANPYTARNAGLDYVFNVLHMDVCVLTDSDCLPAADYRTSLDLYANEDTLVAGRTFTRVPTVGRYATDHFKWLREKNFECYDGFTPPTFTVGSNMVIGASVYKALGPMRDNVVSGGDGEYGERFTHQGGSVVVGTDLIVYKTIYGMSLHGICTKQLRRAVCIADGYRPPAGETLEGLKVALSQQLTVLESAKVVSDLAPNYDEFVDGVFKLMMRYGQLCARLDRP